MQTYPCVDEESLACLSSSWLGTRAFRDRLKIARRTELSWASLEALRGRPGIFQVDLGSDWVEITFDLRAWSRRQLLQRICPVSAKES